MKIKKQNRFLEDMIVSIAVKLFTASVLIIVGWFIAVALWAIAGGY